MHLDVRRFKIGNLEEKKHIFYSNLKLRFNLSSRSCLVCVTLNALDGLVPCVIDCDNFYDRLC